MNDLPRVAARKCVGLESNLQAADRKSSALTTMPLSATSVLTIAAIDWTGTSDRVHIVIVVRGSCDEDNSMLCRSFGRY